MGCLFCIPEKNEEPTESLYIPLLQQDSYHNQNVIYRIDSKSSEDSVEKSLRDSKSPNPIRGSLSFHEDVESPPPVFESCVEENSPTKMSLLQHRLEQLEMNTQENIRLLSEDVHLIYKTMVDKNENKKQESEE